MIRSALVILFTILWCVPVGADIFTPSSSCSKPYKPYEFNDQWEIDAFASEVDRYRRCIEAFVDEQNQAAQSHVNAADEAIEEWNRFVRTELN